MKQFKCDHGVLAQVRRELDNDWHKPTGVELVDVAASKGLEFGDSGRRLGVVI